MIQREQGPRLKKYVVRRAPTILSEASVGAVVKFTWHNPNTGKRERGVFKVLKPHIAEYFLEDMDYLQKLAEYFGDQHLRRERIEYPAVLPGVRLIYEQPWYLRDLPGSPFLPSVACAPSQC